MGLIEKISRNEDIRLWTGEFPVEYLYTAGIAGERYLREIKDNARIMGTRCEGCRIVYVPPSQYCERCFEAMESWVEVGNRGYVHTYTVSYLDLDGRRRKDPSIIALVKFSGVEGGIVHRLGEIEPEDVEIGLQVEAVFKEKGDREGSILDIRYFRPVP